MATNVEKSITVGAPVSVVYNQWTQFEEFPQFMGGVQEVRQVDDSRLHWVAEIGGVKREWDAAILEQVPDRKIAWAATAGATNAGSVHFAAAEGDQTRVTLRLEYEPEGLVEKAGDQLNIIERRAQADLEKFKEFIEDRGSSTGGWRGSVNEGADVTPGVEAAAASRGDSGKAGMSAKAVVTGVAATAVVAAAGALAGKSDSDSAAEIEQDVDDGVDTTPADALLVETGPSVDINDDGTYTATTGTPTTDAASPVLGDGPAASLDDPGRIDEHGR